MLKITISINKKVPGNQPFTNNSFHAGLEREISETCNETIRELYNSNFALLEGIVDSQIEKYENETQPKQSNCQPQLPQQQANYQRQENANYNQPQQSEKLISKAQLKFINDLISKVNVNRSDIIAEVNRRFNAFNISSMKASDGRILIDDLKSRVA